MYRIGRTKRYSGHRWKPKPQSPKPLVNLIPLKKEFGVGSEIKSLLERIDIETCTSCNDKATEWNSRGPTWCKENRSQLVSWIAQQATKKKVSLWTGATKLAVEEPGLAMKIAAAKVMHPMTETAELAASCIVDYATEKAVEKIDALRILDPVPVVVSVTPRAKEIHQRTFAAIREAGFDKVYASCEPGTDTEQIDAELVTHSEKQGQWRNLVQALRIGIGTESPYFITLEDDVELCQGAAELIRILGWPDDKCGCLQLYTSKKLRNYPRNRRFELAITETLDLLGACALMFRRKAAIDLVEWADTKGWRGDTVIVVNEPSKKKAGDTFVGEVLTFLKYKIWIHNPTIANHIGKESTLGHHTSKSDNREQLNFPGIDADLQKIFARDIQCVS